MRNYRSYKFTNKQHSKGGIRSSIAAAVSFVSTAISIYGAYAAGGNGKNYLAFFGTVAIGCCFYGVFEGNRSFKEEECYYVFSRIGTGANLILIIFWIAVVGIGILI